MEKIKISLFFKDSEFNRPSWLFKCEIYQDEKKSIEKLRRRQTFKSQQRYVIILERSILGLWAMLLHYEIRWYYVKYLDWIYIIRENISTQPQYKVRWVGDISLKLLTRFCPRIQIYYVFFLSLGEPSMIVTNNPGITYHS